MKYIFLIIFCITAINLNGQQLTLTYEEAVKLGLTQNADLRTQENLLEVVKAVKSQGLGGLAPNVYANMNGFRANGNTFIQQEARIINTTSDNLNGTFNADLNIFSGFSQINTIKAANANFEAQQKMIQRTSQDVIFQVTSQFLQILLDKEFLRIAQDNLKTQEMLFEQINAMVEAGSKPKSDMYDQKAIVKNNELLVLQTKNKLSNDISTLAITLQVDPKVDIDLVDPGWDLEEIRLFEPDIDELYSISITTRPDLKQYEYEEIAAQKMMQVSKAGFAPTLNAFYTYGTRYNDQSQRSIDEQLFTDNRYNAYGLALNIPIYSGLQNRTRFVRQKINLENAEIFTDNLRKTILNDVKQAYQNYLDVRTAYDVSIARIEAAELALQVQQEKYNLGVGSLVELTNANNNYIDAAAGEARAKLSFLFQKVILDYHTGVLKLPVTTP